MAELPLPRLEFRDQGPDGGVRIVDLPDDLPALGDDFDWRVRDYDGFRISLLEELIARFPERSRWTAADVEVTLVEALSAVLDQLSDMLDRVAAEGTLETARRPGSVRRLLQMIGFDPLGSPFDRPDPVAIPGGTDPREARWLRQQALEQYWLAHPEVMEAARRAGPRAIRTERRMVTVDDYGNRLEDHPLVHRAHAWLEWTGSWTAVRVAVIGWNDRGLEDALAAAGLPEETQAAVDAFHRQHGVPEPRWEGAPTLRQVVGLYLDAYRMAGQEVILQDAVAVGIAIDLAVTVSDRFYRSEVQRAVQHVLGRGPGGFFEPGRLRFGEDLHASDVFEAVMAVEGVEDARLLAFKRVGGRYPDRSAEGSIPLQGVEVAVCDNDPAHPERGYFRLTMTAGRRG
ncbi:MAG TPA: hypothetical protein VF173_23780 [Thermoanaerobaculia bacterium]|nr:hypothetical protein [Thermoanaerobaculia bacterium]